MLTIAGSDSGGGAGIQADLKTFAAHGAYGMSAITAITAQNTRAVTAVHPVPAEIVAAQIDAIFDDLGVDAVKIGMLADAAIVRAVAGALARHGAGRPGGAPVVLDPVMVAKSGDALLADDAVEALVGELLPLATLVTPNLPEAGRMTGVAAATSAAGQAAGGEEMARRLVAAGAAAALVKGGHGAGDELVDLLYDGARIRRFTGRRLATRATHGTGCTLSSAIAARLGAGEDLGTAVEGAIAYLRRAMAAAYPVGGGHGPVNHLVDLEPRRA
ncbi:MAG TPA: bifunctional hydroxymethylpyrimidine kinase/phosphomethylpyrimidine kinase [Thermoanaerobaculia bacterium]|nr:bifunctional hydroxymethylpyrimidine kinase/phosphomethylpyrimidine kinase [Thermoanaerobaculia bacterium]